MQYFSYVNVTDATCFGNALLKSEQPSVKYVYHGAAPLKLGLIIMSSQMDLKPITILWSLISVFLNSD